MLNQNCDFGVVLSPLQGQVLLRYGNLFRVPQKITCSEQGFRKIRFANGLELAKKNSPKLFSSCSYCFDFKGLKLLRYSFTK